MARRKSGISQEALDRIHRQLEDRGSYGQKYEEAMFGREREVNPPTEGAESALSINELCLKLGLDYSRCFDRYEPVVTTGGYSSRVRAMQFLPDGDLREILTSKLKQDGESPLNFLARVFTYTITDEIIGSVVVEWVNRPSGGWHWEYYDVPLREYLNFRDAPSPGKYLNLNTMPIHGAYAG